MECDFVLGWAKKGQFCDLSKDSIPGKLPIGSSIVIGNGCETLKQPLQSSTINLTRPELDSLLAVCGRLVAATKMRD
jgi:hypothetical protein